MITRQMIGVTHDEVMRFSNNFYRFLRDLDFAECDAVTKFKKAKDINDNVRYVKIELDGEYPKNFIEYAVENYRKSWKRVTFGISDKTPGSYEPTHKWIIKIDTKE